MWARWAELAIGLWLLASPWIFGHGESEIRYWARDLAGGSVLVSLALLSLRMPEKRLYLLVPATGAALIGVSFFAAPHPLPPALQNDVVVGLTVLMLGIVPDRAFEPPRKWREFRRGS